MINCGEDEEENWKGKDGMTKETDGRKKNIDGWPKKSKKFIRKLMFEEGENGRRNGSVEDRASSSGHLKS